MNGDAAVVDIELVPRLNEKELDSELDFLKARMEAALSLVNRRDSKNSFLQKRKDEVVTLSQNLTSMIQEVEKANSVTDELGRKYRSLFSVVGNMAKQMKSGVGKYSSTTEEEYKQTAEAMTKARTEYQNSLANSQKAYAKEQSSMQSLIETMEESAKWYDILERRRENYAKGHFNKIPDEMLPGLTDENGQDVYNNALNQELRLKKEEQKIDKDANAERNKALGIEHQKADVATRILNAVNGTANAMREANNASRNMAKSVSNIDTSMKRSTAQIYYFVRSLKMGKEQIDRMYGNVKKLDAIFLRAMKNGIKWLFTLGTGFKAFNRNVKSATKSHDGFVGSLGKGFMTVLKYTIGIRSLYFLFNKLRRALSEGMEDLAGHVTHVNGQMSSIVSSLAWMRNAAATAVQPLLNVLAPALDRVAAAFANAALAIGSFFAALTGQKFVYKAIKPTLTYADALEDTAGAAKDATKQLSGLDKLNVLTTDDSKGKGAGASGGGYEVQEIEAAYNSLADRLKSLFESLFDPIKKAWEKVGKWVMDQWTRALKNIKSLIKTIGKDFLEVWGNETGLKIWEDIFIIIGDIGAIVANLAENFERAWKKNNVGKKILEDIQLIIYDIVHAIRLAADNTVEWSKSLDFYNLLESIESLLSNAIEPAIKRIADLGTYIWGGIDEAGNKFGLILPFVKYMVEEGLPEMNRTIEKIIKNVDWDKLTDRLKEFTDHFEPFLEKCWRAWLYILEDIGIAIGDVLNSDAFGNFLKWLEDLMDAADPRQLATDIERIGISLLTITGILKGLSILGGIVINIGTFANAIMNIKNLIGSGQGLGIAGLVKDFGQLGGIKGIIGGVSETLSYFFTSFLPQMATNFNTVFVNAITRGSQALRFSVQGTFGTIGSAILSVVSIITGSVMAITSFFDMWNEGFSWAKEAVMLLGIALVAVGAIILGAPATVALAIAGIVAAVTSLIVVLHDNWENVKQAIDSIPEKVREFGEKLVQKAGEIGQNLGKKIGELVANAVQAFKDFPKKFKEWAENVDWAELGLYIVKGILYIFSAAGKLMFYIMEAIGNFVLSFIKGFKDGFQIHSPSKVMEPYGEFLVTGILEGILSIIKNIGSWIYTHLAKPIIDAVGKVLNSNTLVNVGTNLLNGLKNGITAGWNKVKGAVTGVWNSVTQGAKNAFKVHSPSQEFNTIGGYIVEGLSQGVSQSDSVTQQFQTIMNNAMTILNSKEFQDKGKEIVLALDGSLEENFPKVHDFLKSSWDNIKKVADTALNAKTLFNNGKDFLNGMQNGINSIKDKLLSNASNIWTKIQQTRITEKSLFGVGGNLVRGLVNGIKTVWGNLSGHVSSIWASVINSAKSAFQTHSPSKVFEEIGGYLTEGLVIGVEDESDEVGNAFSDMLSVDALDEFYQHFISILSQMRLESIQIVDSMIYELNNLFANLDKLGSIQNLTDNLAKLSSIQLPSITVGAVVPTAVSASISKQRGSESEQKVETSNDDVVDLLEAILNAINNIDTDGTVEIDGKEIFKVVRSQNNQYKKQYGSSALA